MKKKAQDLLNIMGEHIMNFSDFYKENVDDIHNLNTGNLYPQGTGGRERSLNVSPVLSRLNESVERYNEKLFVEDVPALRKFIEEVSEEQGEDSYYVKDLSVCLQKVMKCDLSEISVLTDTKFFKSNSDVFIKELKAIRVACHEVLGILSDIPFLNGGVDALYETMNSARSAHRSESMA
jgi:hypothetical protein